MHAVIFHRRRRGRRPRRRYQPGSVFIGGADPALRVRRRGAAEQPCVHAAAAAARLRSPRLRGAAVLEHARRCAGFQGRPRLAVACIERSMPHWNDSTPWAAAGHHNL